MQTTSRTPTSLLFGVAFLGSLALLQASPLQDLKTTSEPVQPSNPNTVVWEGEQGIGKGKHIVFIAGDHEYRGEESLPALARILAKSYGFKCTFLVTTNPETNEIQPGSSHISNLEVLKTADLMVLFVRFQNFGDDQMQHIEDYLQKGKPVLGLRTSTHGFQGIEGKFVKYNEGYQGHEPLGDAAGETSSDGKALGGGTGTDWQYGFGEQILGEHWVGHFGRNHKQSSNLLLEVSQKLHPILRGVTRPHAVTGGYVGHPVQGSRILARGQILDGMSPDSPVAAKEEQQVLHAVAWVRHYQENNPQSRVFATTHGGSEDLLNDDMRRMLINAHLWCLGFDESIRPDGPIQFIGPYHPATFNFGGYRKGVKVSDISGFDSPIYDPSKSTAKPAK